MDQTLPFQLTHNDEQQVNRRLFLKYAATATAGAVSIAMKSDALAQQQDDPFRIRANGDGHMPYPYHNGP